MQSLNDIKKRIKSVKNTRQITKAMEVVSATKMRKAQERALRARGYAFSAFELLANLSRYEGKMRKPELFVRPEGANKTLLVVIASDKGLAGSLNSNVLKKAFAWYKKVIANNANGAGNNANESDGVDVVAAGKKTRDYFKFRNVPILQTFFGHGDFADYEEVAAISDYLQQQYATHQYSRVVAIYTNFRSTLKQEAVVHEILPLKNDAMWELATGLVPEKGKFADAPAQRIQPGDYLFEPSPERVFRELTGRLFQMMVYHIFLESNASEHSARMVAMKTASENAEEIAQDLTLEFNKGRQAKITQEIVEITSGSQAIN